ncbi:MAG TPA: hypothetical protein VE178_11220 [Silvibacterium sp.]|nr:hypothetical protein [Silvibacterium sp.]
MSILFFRHLQRIFPVFIAYLFWVLASDPVLLLIGSNPSTGSHYAQVYFAFSIVQFFLELSVLIEIAAIVIRPAKGSLPRTALLILAGIVALVGIGGFFFTAHLNAATLAHPRTYFVMSTTMAIARLITFLVIAALSQVLGLGWRNHVLQLASGLAFYAAVTLVVELAHSNLRAGPEYARDFYALDHLRVLGYLCALTYWCYSFVRKEAPRKEFSPQMAQLLVSLSGSAKRHSVTARSLDIKRP